MDDREQARGARLVAGELRFCGTPTDVGDPRELSVPSVLAPTGFWHLGLPSRSSSNTANGSGGSGLNAFSFQETFTRTLFSVFRSMGITSLGAKVATCTELMMVLVLLLLSHAGQSHQKVSVQLSKCCLRAGTS